MAFAAAAAAAPALQQSEASRALTICVVYGADVVPRLGARSVTLLMEELGEHGVLAAVRRTVAPRPADAAGAGHAYEYFRFWRGLSDGGRCTGCGKKQLTTYCARCFLCEACGGAGPCKAALQLTGPEPEPEAATEDESPAPIGGLALGGRVLWAQPEDDPAPATLRWCEWRDFGRIALSAQMLAHHLPASYLQAARRGRCCHFDALRYTP